MQDSSPNRPSRPFRLHTPSPDLQSITFSMRKSHIDLTQIVTDYDALNATRGLSESFDSLSTAYKCDHLRLPGAHPMVILRLLNLGSQRNTLRALAGPLRPAASGVQSYKNFCDFARRPPFPADSGTILLRSALFRSGKTFGIYSTHVMKAAILLGQPTDWPTPNVRSLAKGPRLAAGKSFAFENFMMASGLLALLKVAKLSTDFGLSAFPPFYYFGERHLKPS